MNKGKRNAQKACFGIMNGLRPGLEMEGLTEESVWAWVKGEYDVVSRSELDDREWAIVSARLSAATRDQKLFLVLCEAVRTAVGTCRVYRGYADYTFKKVYDGVITSNIKERCQRQADATGCFVNLCGADSPDSKERFEPAEYAPDPNCPPIAPNNPNRPSKVFELHRSSLETQTVEIRFPDCSDLEGWGQRHADESGFDTIITDRMGHNVLMEFTATPAPAPPSIEDIAGGGVSVNGQAWVLLNQWDNQWHWVKLDRSMERHVADADNRQAAVESLVAYIVGGV